MDGLGGVREDIAVELDRLSDGRFENETIEREVLASGNVTSSAILSSRLVEVKCRQLNETINSLKRRHYELTCRPLNKQVRVL